MAGNLLLALGRTYAALGRPDAAQAMLRVSRLGPLETNLYALALFREGLALGRGAADPITVALMSAEPLTIVLGWVVLPYRADHLAEREQLAAQMEAEYWKASEFGFAELPPPRALRHELLLVEGDWAGAEAAARAVLRTPTRHWWPNEARATLGTLARHRGELDAAWTHVRVAFPQGPATEPGETQFRSAVELQRLAAGLALDAGDLASARAWLEAHDRWLAWSGAVLGQAEGHLGWTDYYRAAGDPTLAHQHAEQAMARANDPRQPLALLAVHRLLGLLHTEAGRHGEAGTHLEQSLTLAEACAAPYERALTLLALAELRAATGNRDAARALLDEAHAILAPLDANPALARADALATRLAAEPPPARAAAHGLPAGLTSREAEVLRLVAEGLTNAQVADRLSLSPRTVDRHLNAIYTKLGVGSRSAATRFALEHRLA
jgi:DNA-binding CsgD family transcriptional regulator